MAEDVDADRLYTLRTGRKEEDSRVGLCHVSRQDWRARTEGKD